MATTANEMRSKSVLVTIYYSSGDLTLDKNDDQSWNYNDSLGGAINNYLQDANLENGAYVIDVCIDEDKERILEVMKNK